MGDMAKIEEIKNMTLEELRPYIQRAMGLEEWPRDDWVVVGMIFDQTASDFTRMAGPPHNYEARIMGKGVGNGIGTGLGSDPVVAIFRGYLTWRSHQALLERKDQK